MGVVHQDKKVFEFLPGQDGITAVREIDSPKFPREYVPEEETAIIPEEAVHDIEGLVEERPPFPQYPIKILILFPSNEFGLCHIATIITNFDWSILEEGFEHHIEDVFDHFDPTNITVDVDIACIDLPDEDVETLEQKRDWLKDDAIIADLRDDHNADLVSLLVQDGENCGIGMSPGLLAPRFQTHAFTVVKMDCALADYSLMHELGHNFGMYHDRFKTNGGLDYVCRYGFNILINGVPEYRTPMAYYDYCGSLGLACPRVPTYSQDKVITSNILGVEIQLGIGCDVLSEDINGSANNRQQLIKAAPYISNYR